MGNKVIKFGNSKDQLSRVQARTEVQLSQNEVYVDVSMKSVPNENRKLPYITDEKYRLLANLAQEHPSTLRANDLIVTEYERADIQLQYGVDYGQFQRDYDTYLALGPWKVSANADIKAIQGSLHNIFTWIPGERILNPEFGSTVRKLLYEGLNDFNTEHIISEIRASVSQWEPRVRIVDIISVTTDDDREDNTVHLEVIYTIPSLSQEKYHYSIYAG